jgi:hypothetical protein
MGTAAILSLFRPLREGEPKMSEKQLTEV